MIPTDQNPKKGPDVTGSVVPLVRDERDDDESPSLNFDQGHQNLLDSSFKNRFLRHIANHQLVYGVSGLLLGSLMLLLGGFSMQQAHLMPFISWNAIATGLTHAGLSLSFLSSSPILAPVLATAFTALALVVMGVSLFMLADRVKALWNQRNVTTEKVTIVGYDHENQFYPLYLCQNGQDAVRLVDRLTSKKDKRAYRFETRDVQRHENNGFWVEEILPTGTVAETLSGVWFIDKGKWFSYQTSPSTEKDEGTTTISVFQPDSEQRFFAKKGNQEVVAKTPELLKAWLGEEVEVSTRWVQKSREKDSQDPQKTSAFLKVFGESHQEPTIFKQNPAKVAVKGSSPDQDYTGRVYIHTKPN